MGAFQALGWNVPETQGPKTVELPPTGTEELNLWTCLGRAVSSFELPSTVNKH